MLIQKECANRKGFLKNSNIAGDREMLAAVCLRSSIMFYSWSPVQTENMAMIISRLPFSEWSRSAASTSSLCLMTTALACPVTHTYPLDSSHSSPAIVSLRIRNCSPWITFGAAVMQLQNSDYFQQVRYQGGGEMGAYAPPRQTKKVWLRFWFRP